MVKKLFFVSATIFWLMIFLMIRVWGACKSGYVPSDTPGVCVEKPIEATNPAWIVDEKVPSDKMPSYQREGISVVNAPPGVEPSSNTAHDYRAESEGR